MDSHKTGLKIDRTLGPNVITLQILELQFHFKRKILHLQCLRDNISKTHK